jgi:shikimate kinase
MRISRLLACVCIAAAVAEGSGAAGTAAPQFRTTRTVALPAGSAVRTFELRERSGVILLNRLSVRPGMRVVVSARIPRVAGVRVASTASPATPEATCRRQQGLEICTQGEEWCPMPRATWHVRLVKLGGPAGVARFDLVIGAPPTR